MTLCFCQAVGYAHEDDADDDDDDAGVLGRLELLFEEDAREDSRDDAVGGDHRGGDDRVLGERIYIEHLTELLEERGGSAGFDLRKRKGIIRLLFFYQQDYPCDYGGEEEREAVQDQNVYLAQSQTRILVEDDAVGGCADGVENAVQYREEQRESAVAVLAILIGQVEGFLFSGEFLLDNTQSDNAAHDEHGADNVDDTELFPKAADSAGSGEPDEHHDSRESARGVLHRRYDGYLQIAHTGVADDHRDDVAERSRQILNGACKYACFGVEEGLCGYRVCGILAYQGGQRLLAEREDGQQQREYPHHQADPYGGLEVRVAVAVDVALLIEEVGEAPSEHTYKR